MFQIHTTLSDSGRRYEMAFSAEKQPITTAQFYRLLGTNESFRTQFTQALADLPFDAFFWETPAATLATLENNFECVVIEGRSFARRTPNFSPFSQQFASQDQAKTAIQFANLGGDAMLVVPRPLVEDAAYPHLVAFLRKAPAAQIHAFWQVLSEAFTARVSTVPVWVSTAGMGVIWLHVRLDNRPKYYRHQPYRMTHDRQREQRY